MKTTKPIVTKVAKFILFFAAVLQCCPLCAKSHDADREMTRSERVACRITGQFLNYVIANRDKMPVYGSIAYDRFLKGDQADTVIQFCPNATVEFPVTCYYNHKNLYFFKGGGCARITFGNDFDQIENETPKISIIPLSETNKILKGLYEYQKSKIEHPILSESKYDILYNKKCLKIIKKTRKIKNGQSIEIKYKGFIIQLLNIPNNQYQILTSILDTFTVGEVVNPQVSNEYLKQNGLYQERISFSSELWEEDDE